MHMQLCSTSANNVFHHVKEQKAQYLNSSRFCFHGHSGSKYSNLPCAEKEGNNFSLAWNSQWYKWEFLPPSQLNEPVKFKVKVTVVNSESSWNPLTMMPTNAQITAESGNLTLTNEAHKSYSIGPKNT